MKWEQNRLFLKSIKLNNICECICIDQYSVRELRILLKPVNPDKLCKNMFITAQNFLIFLFQICSKWVVGVRERINLCNRTAKIRHQCRKTTVLSCHRCLINTGFEKNEPHLNIDYNFEYMMSPSKSKWRYLNNYLHFEKFYWKHINGVWVKQRPYSLLVSAAEMAIFGKLS